MGRLYGWEGLMRWLMEGREGPHPSRRWIPPGRRTVNFNWFYTFSAHVKGSDDVDSLHLSIGERVASHFCDLHIVLIHIFLWCFAKICANLCSVTSLLRRIVWLSDPHSHLFRKKHSRLEPWANIYLLVGFMCNKNKRSGQILSIRL